MKNFHAQVVPFLVRISVEFIKVNWGVEVMQRYAGKPAGKLALFL